MARSATIVLSFSIALQMHKLWGVPRDPVARLRDLGYRCIPVGDIGMTKATEEDTLTFSLGKHAIVVTLDADFHMMLAVSGAADLR
jgi:hypothetical protein